VVVTCNDYNETEVPVAIPLDEIKVIKNKEHKKELKLSEEIMITMGYPSLDMFVKMNFAEENVNQVDQIFEMATSCIQTIADPNQIYDCADVPKEELSDFFDQLNSKQFQMIQGFFETMPKLSHTVEVTNPNTKKKTKVVLEGLASFFA
jgi:hypothetical protein